MKTEIKNRNKKTGIWAYGVRQKGKREELNIIYE